MTTLWPDKNAADGVLLGNWRSQVGDAYSLDELAKRPNSYSLLVTTPRRRYVLKAHRHIHPLAYHQQQVIATNRLKHWGFPTPGTMNTTDGELGLADEAGWYWVLYDYMEGTGYNGGQAQMKAAAKLMAQIHERLAKSDLDSAIAPGYEELSRDERWRALVWGCTHVGGPDRAFAVDVLKALVLLVKTEKEGAGWHLEWSRQTKQAALRDFQPSSLLFRADQVAALLDVEVARDILAIPVAFAAWRFWPEKPAVFVKAYGGESIGALRDWYRWEVRRRANWIVRFNALRGSPWAVPELWREELARHLGDLW